MAMRLQKYLALCGVASRRRAEQMILEGLVQVNGQTVREMGVQVQEIRADDARATALLGWYLANLGEPVEAREQLLRAESLAGERGLTAIVNAKTLSLVGSEEEMLQRVATAREAGFPEERIRSDAVLGKIPAVVGTQPGNGQ